MCGKIFNDHKWNELLCHFNYSVPKSIFSFYTSIANNNNDLPTVFVIIKRVFEIFIIK